MALEYLKPWLFFLALICVSCGIFRWTHVEYIKKQALVTMFTVIEDRKASDTVYKRVLTNWATLMPKVLPLLYVPQHEWDSSRWKGEALSRGWRVQNINKLRKKRPILSDMFKQTLRESESPFVGFANADILFDESIIRTLEYLMQIIDVDNWTILITGKSRILNTAMYELGSGNNLSHITLMKMKTDVGYEEKEDYFIISRKGLPWDEMPDFVIGTSGFDKWLLVMAQDWNVMAIDASLTMLALCQRESEFPDVKTAKYNISALSWSVVEDFAYKRARTECLPFYTTFICEKRNGDDFCFNPTDTVLRQRALYPYVKGLRQILAADC